MCVCHVFARRGNNGVRARKHPCDDDDDDVLVAVHRAAKQDDT